jgi:hypothetical protein
MKRIFVFSLLAGAIATSNASLIINLSNGTFSTGGGVIQSNETVSLTNIAGLATGDAMSFFESEGVSTFGQVTFTHGTDNLVFDTELTAFAPGGPTNVSLAGVWEYDAGLSTGIFANLAGSGTYSQSLLVTKSWDRSEDVSGLVGTQFVGELNAVPEPASLAVLGIGVAAIVRRRRNRS